MALRPAAVVVMGVSGSGKSTLAQRLALELDCPFIEGDALHDPASVAKMAAGVPLQDADRWPWLDRIGAALRECCEARGLAVAACSALRYAYRERLRRAIAAPAFFILLDAPHAELERRLRQRTGHFMPASLLDSQLATLERPSPGEHALALDAGQSPELLCRASREWLDSVLHR
ncbi:MAG TPA: gluconokinase [Steroidobacteraceae bacterium]|nr:gluconokinase [Steroidobacteraceae bacterium]